MNDLKERFKGKFIDASYKYVIEREAGRTREQMIAGETGKEAGRMWDLIMKEVNDPDNPNFKPDPLDLKKVYRSQLALYSLFMDFAIGRLSYVDLVILLQNIRIKTGTDRAVFFTVDLEPRSTAEIYKQYQKITPFKRVSGIWRMREPNEEYYDLVTGFIQAGAEAKFLLIPNYFPGDYCEYMYDDSDIAQKSRSWPYSDLFNPAILPYQQDHIYRLMAILRRFYTEKDIEVSLSNEIGHHGDHDFGRILAKAHEQWFGATGLELEKVLLDSSHSDYVPAELVERHQDPDGIWVGNDKYARNDHHHAIAIHGFGIAENLDNPVEPGHSRTWYGWATGTMWRWAYRRWSSDGSVHGSGTKYVLHENKPDGKAWRDTTGPELQRLGEAIWGLWPKDIIEDLPMAPWRRTPDDPHNAYIEWNDFDSTLERLAYLNKARV